jgi:hypothetical protein
MLSGDAPPELPAKGEGGTASGSSTDFAEIDLGAPNVTDNITHPQGGDGDTTNISVGSRTARRNVDPNEDFYFYFAVDDSFAFPGGQPELSITIDYFDSGTGTLTLQYDSDTGDALPAFYKHGGNIHLTGTNTWKQHTFQLNDAYFGNRQNQDADFRIFGGVGNTFYLDRLQVTSNQTSPPIHVSGEIQIPGQSDWTLRGTALTAGDPGSWDVRFHGQISPSSVIKKDGVYYLYYVGADGNRSTDGGPSHRNLGVATSTDGINFTKHPGNPVISHLPHNNQEEGIFSAGTALAANGDIVLVYGAIWAANSTTESVQSHVALATSSDGLNFTDHRYVLSWNDNNVWGYGDELFGVGTFYSNDTWHVYYIAKGNQGSWKLAIGTGPDLDNLTTTSGVITSGDFVIGGGDPVFLSEDKIALFNVRKSDKAYIEVRTADISSPGNLSAPVRSYDTFPYAHATVFLDEQTDTWFMYQATDRQEDGNEIVVRTAPLTRHSSSGATLFGFDSDPEGWRLETWKSGPYSPGTVAWEASGGNPAGTIRSTGSGSSNNEDTNTREGNIITRSISTQGAKDIQIEYDVKVALDSPPDSSGTGGNGNLLEDSLEDKLVVYYSTSGTNGPWTAAQVLSEDGDLPNVWSGQSIDLIGTLGVDDNADFALRFQWQFNTANDTGWIDNVRVSQADLLGDYNRNGAVDAADYTVYRDTFGSTSDLRADGNGNGSIEIGDYGVWRTNFGLAAAQASAQLIEEPAPLTLSDTLPDVDDNDVANVSERAVANEAQGLLFGWLDERQPALSNPGVNPPQAGLEPLDQKLRDEQDQLAIIAQDEALGSLRFDEGRDDRLPDGTLQDENGESSTDHISFGVDPLMGPDFDLDI